MSHKKGSLEVICGSMFSGKTEELIKRLHRAEIAKRKIIVFKHTIDNRRSTEFITSHGCDKIFAVEIVSPQELLNNIDHTIDVIGIDEVQFFNNEIINVILKLINMGKRVIVAGLDLDFRGFPFGCIPDLMALADEITKLRAVCMQCGQDAHFTQRIVNNKPAKFDDPIILVGAEDYYQARCRNCYKI